MLPAEIKLSANDVTSSEWKNYDVTQSVSTTHRFYDTKTNLSDEMCTKIATSDDTKIIMMMIQKKLLDTKTIFHALLRTKTIFLHSISLGA